MSTTVYVDPKHDDAWSRDRLYDGDLIVYSARRSIEAGESSYENDPLWRELEKL